MTADDLVKWLALVQGYAVRRSEAERIGRVSARFDAVDQQFGGDTLFWTEPSNTERLLNNSAPGDQRNLFNG